jgi:hypothetical protein
MDPLHRNLVIVMAGDGSLHETYARDRDFELWVCYWGRDPAVAERFRTSCDRLWQLTGEKWSLMRQVAVRASREGLPRFSAYDYVFLSDDDILFPEGAAAVSRLFAIARDIDAHIFQPAIANEHVSPGHEPTRRNTTSLMRATNIVEIMMPALTGRIVEGCLLPILHVHPHVRAGWGLEALLQRTTEAVFGRTPRTFVIDAIEAHHTRPVGQGSASHALGWDEAFMNPLAGAIPTVELARFGNMADAAAFVFPPSDAHLNLPRLSKHLSDVRLARLIVESLRKNTPASRSLRQLVQQLIGG